MWYSWNRWGRRKKIEYRVLMRTSGEEGCHCWATPVAWIPRATTLYYFFSSHSLPISYPLFRSLGYRGLWGRKKNQQHLIYWNFCALVKKALRNAPGTSFLNVLFTLFLALFHPRGALLLAHVWGRSFMVNGRETHLSRSEQECLDFQEIGASMNRDFWFITKINLRDSGGTEINARVKNCWAEAVKMLRESLQSGFFICNSFYVRSSCR